MQAREIMTEDPACCTPSDSVRAAAKMMKDTNCGVLPVVNNQEELRLIGMLTDRDIVCRVLASDGMDCQNASVQNAMTSAKLWSVRPNASVDEVIEKMEEGQVRRIPVVDEQNTILGIVSMADIALELDDEEEIAEVIEEISEPTNIPHA